MTINCKSSVVEPVVKPMDTAEEMVLDERGRCQHYTSVARHVEYEDDDGNIFQLCGKCYRKLIKDLADE